MANKGYFEGDIMDNRKVQLKPEHLKHFDGQPIWVVPLLPDFHPEWCFVQDYEGEVWDRYHESYWEYHTYGEKWIAFALPSRFPHQVGDILWGILDDKPVKLKLKKIVETQKAITYVCHWYEYRSYSHFGNFRESSFGKTLFMSYEAAEQAIRGEIQ